MKKKIYIIWAWGIWISAIARYYNHIGWEVFWSDSTSSELIDKLNSEWNKINIGEFPERIDGSFELVVYTEAIPENQSELQKAHSLWIPTLTYPQALAEIANKKKLIAIAGTHGKSTTTSITSIILKNSDIWVNAVIGTLLKEFWWRNAYFSESDYFTIEACEYKRSFLAYKPYIGIITNIEIDHLDYYKDLDDYISAYKDFIENIVPRWYVILNGNDNNCRQLLNLRHNISYIQVFEKYYILNGEKIFFPKVDMKVPWWHILYDWHIWFIVWQLLLVNNKSITQSLEWYTWVWRRMEIVWKTGNNNILISDYWHHPTEIELTLSAIKEKYSGKKIITLFQPHQYNRTIELLKWFRNCFSMTDILIIPDIYESRDSDKDKEKMSVEILLDNINHWHKINWQWLQNTLSILNNYEKDNFWNSVIILLWAWNIDNLRYKIETH